MKPLSVIEYIIILAVSLVVIAAAKPMVEEWLANLTADTTLQIQRAGQ
jgi:hypothetical protein